MSRRIILSLALIGLFASNAIQSMENEITNNRYALHDACKNGQLEKTKLLIEAGADVNAKITQGCFQGYTPLHKAAWNGRAEIARLLIGAGADVNAKELWGNTPLHLAVFERHAEVVQALIGAGAEVNTENKNGKAPLHHAAADGYAEVAKLLIEAGADVDAKDNYGCAPLHWAAVEGYAKKDNYGSTPLHWAAEEDHVEVAKALIKASAEVNANDDGWTPLHFAANRGSAEFATILLSNKAQLPRVQGSPASFTKKDGALEILDLKSLIFLTILEDLNNIEKEEREDHLNSLRSYPDFINILENPSENLADFCKHKHLEFLGNFVGMKTIKNAVGLAVNETALDIAQRRKRKHQRLALLLAAAGNFLDRKKAAEVLKDENGVNVLGIADEDLLNRLQEIIPDLEQKIDENIEEMLTFKVLKQEMSLEDEPKLS